MASKKTTPKRPQVFDLVTTDELLDEIQRRSVGLYVCLVKVDEGNNDVWSYRIKGSVPLMGAMSSALAMEIEKTIQRTQTNEGGYGQSF